MVKNSPFALLRCAIAVTDLDSTKVSTGIDEINNSPVNTGITTKSGKENNNKSSDQITETTTEQVKMKTTEKEDNRKQYKVLIPPSPSQNLKKKRNYNKKSQPVQKNKIMSMLQPKIKIKDNPRKKDNPRVECETLRDDPTESGPVNGDARASSPRECDMKADAQPASTDTQILAPEINKNTLSETTKFSHSKKPDLAGNLEIKKTKTFTSKPTAWD